MKNFYNKSLCSIILALGINATAFSQIYTFTNAGATGNIGPTQAQITAAYAATNLAGNVTSTNGIQSWSIPVGGRYKIEVYGAEGYGNLAGKGAYMSGEFDFIVNTPLKILVGQQGSCCVGSGTQQFGGGGGSFVTSPANVPYIVAGGGGGANGNTAIVPNSNGSTAINGNPGTGTASGAGGVNGAGGAEAGIAGGGGGFNGDGGGTPHGGKSFLNGGIGGVAASNGGMGGFGGGGGANSWDNRRGGGGGGYSGGGGGGSSTSSQEVGGGGGSINNGLSQVNTAGVRSGHGMVVITLLYASNINPNDIGATSIPSLVSGFCAGTQMVTANIMNFGNSYVDSALINWSVNGVIQPSVWRHFTPRLDTVSTPNSSRVVNVGNYNFPSGTHTVKVWTSLPNNILDTVKRNDTATFVGSTKLGGTYTINNLNPTAGTNFASFTDFATAISSVGVCAPVVVNVANNPTPYNERLSLGVIDGVSAVNTVRINGNGATLQFNPTSAATAQLVTLNGTKYVTIDSLTIKTLNSTYGWGVAIAGSSQYDTIRNCFIDLSSISGTSSTNSNGITISGSLTSATANGLNSNIYIANNTIDGGRPTTSCGTYYGIAIRGTNSSSFGADSIYIINNTIRNFYYYGIYAYYTNEMHIIGNDVSRPARTATTTAYAIYSYYMGRGSVKNNRVHDLTAPSYSHTNSVYAIYLNYPNYSASVPKARYDVTNNAVYNIGTGATNYLLYVYGGDSAYIAHNSVNVNRTGTSSSTMYGIYAYNTSNSYTLKNNVVNYTAGNSGTKYGIYCSNNTMFNNNSGLQNNNVFFNSSQSGAQHRIYYGSAYANLAAFRTAYPALENGSIDVDPEFVDAETGDLRPDNALLLNTGENLTAIVPRDINNILRPMEPTPGAFENIIIKGANDFSVNALIEPQTVCAGPYDIQVRLRNFGLNKILSGRVHWTMNGVAQPTLMLPAMNLDTFRALNPYDTIVTLGNYTFATQPVVLKAWTHLPNGVADTMNLNDTLEVTLYPAMNGTYTINSALPTGGTNYESFSDLADALNVRGVCGPVVVNVVPGSGPYTDRLLLGNISGTSPINTIRINGNGERMQYNATGTSDMQMVVFNGTKYTTLDSLHIKTLNATYGYGVIFTSGAKYDSLTRCHIDLSTITGSSSVNACGIAVSGSTTSATTSGQNGSHLFIDRNIIDAGSPTSMYGAYYAVSLYGEGTSTYGFDSSYVTNNIIRNYYYYGINAYYGVGNVIKGNDIHKKDKTQASTNYGISLYYNNEFVLEGNRVHDFAPTVASTNTTYGIYVYYGNFYGTKKAPSFITNNAVYNVGNSGGVLYGIYVYYGDSIYVLHNTVDVSLTHTTGTSTQYCMYVYNITNSYFVKNNNVSYTGGNNGTKYGIYISNNSMFNTNLGLQNNNIYFNTPRTGTIYRAYYGTGYANLAAFQAAFPTLEVDGMEADPQYLNPANDDYTPMSIDVMMQGENLNGMVAEDIRGSNRPSPPTPGAWDLSPEDYDNTGVDSLINPGVNFCSGLRDIRVRIRNYGINDVDTVQIHWTVNGQVRPTITNYTLIPGTLSSSNNTAIVTLGSEFLAYGRNYEIKAWTALPNNLEDDYNVDDTLTQVITPASTIPLNIGNDTTICDNNSLTLVAGVAQGYTYRWDDLGTAPSRYVFQPGVYHVIKTQISSGCAAVDTITISTIPAPIVDMGTEAAICEGDSFLLDVGAANYGSQILWNDNSTATTRYVSTAGIYTVTITAPNGCFTVEEFELKYKDEPLIDGINAVLMLDGSYNFNVRNPQYVQYAIWDYGDGSPRDTGNYVNHRYASNGLFQVKVYLISVCGESEGNAKFHSETIDVFDATSTKELENVSMKLYPNPATEHITVEMDGAMINAIEVYNVLGQKVHVATLPIPNAKAQINTQKLVSGMYHLHIQTNKGVVIRKVEILK